MSTDFTAFNTTVDTAAQTLVDSATAPLNTQITSLKAQVTQLNQRVANRDATISSLNNQIASLKAQITALNTQITTLNAQVADLQAKLAAATQPTTPPPPPPPTATGFPDASNTGVPAGTVLRSYSGSDTILTAGTVLDGYDISFGLVVRAANVTIKNCRIHYNDFFGIDAADSTGLTVQNCDIIGPGYNGDSPAAILASGMFIGNDISGAEHGISLQGGASTIKSNYFHDGGSNKTDPHIGGISLKGGQNGVLIEGNTVVGRDTSDVFLQDNFAAINDVTIRGNLLIGDPGYNIYVEGRLGHGTTNVRVENNVLKQGHYGYFSITQASPVMSGNTDYITGQPVNA